MAVFFSGKPMVDNIEAWRTILRKIRPFFRRTIVLNRNGAAVLAMDAVFEDMGGIPKRVVLHGYKPDYRYDDAELVVPTEIEDSMPTLDLSMVKHVFHIEADGVLFVASVDGTKVTAKRGLIWNVARSRRLSVHPLAHQALNLVNPFPGKRRFL